MRRSINRCMGTRFTHDSYDHPEKTMKTNLSNTKSHWDEEMIQLSPNSFIPRRHNESRSSRSIHSNKQHFDDDKRENDPTTKKKRKKSATTRKNKQKDDGNDDDENNNNNNNNNKSTSKSSSSCLNHKNNNNNEAGYGDNNDGDNDGSKAEAEAKATTTKATAKVVTVIATAAAAALFVEAALASSSRTSPRVSSKWLSSRSTIVCSPAPAACNGAVGVSYCGCVKFHHRQPYVGSSSF